MVWFGPNNPCKLSIPIGKRHEEKILTTALGKGPFNSLTSSSHPKHFREGKEGNNVSKVMASKLFSSHRAFVLGFPTGEKLKKDARSESDPVNRYFVQQMAIQNHRAALTLEPTATSKDPLLICTGISVDFQNFTPVFLRFMSKINHPINY
ncbi:hypothetical protein EGR_10884 [Echinococcus granulosus]|uniref:Uncharacterized protein n=1 Tax=Echinococcus granulosus TaxID=6210 RepID=W6TZT5_ECHGR|nr:hypothetical protein EGR_10884 [Echinococcus granulosus]EUB54258.1 hypothetical protein EGR_10884 [Echinococcus granulosus]